MAEEEKYTLVVHYLNGAEDKFEFTTKEDAKLNVAAQMQKILASDTLIIDIKDRTLMIPKQSIRSIELTPGVNARKLPENALRNVRKIT